MIKYFYATDYGNDDQKLSAFTKKATRDNFVDCGNRRYATTRIDADRLSKNTYGCCAKGAATKGYIREDTQ
jgi:hypothetical protein